MVYHITTQSLEAWRTRLQTPMSVAAAGRGVLSDKIYVYAHAATYYT